MPPAPASNNSASDAVRPPPHLAHMNLLTHLQIYRKAAKGTRAAQGYGVLIDRSHLLRVNLFNL